MVAGTFTTGVMSQISTMSIRYMGSTTMDTDSPGNATGGNATSAVTQNSTDPM